MPRYVIERQYLVPVYEHLLIEAANLDEACRQASDDIEQPWGDDARTDYESARETTVARAVELPESMPAAGADDRSLSHLLYDAGLEPLLIPAEFSAPTTYSNGAIGFV